MHALITALLHVLANRNATFCSAIGCFAVDNTSHHIMVAFQTSDGLPNTGAPASGYGYSDGGLFRLSPTNGDIV